MLLKRLGFLIRNVGATSFEVVSSKDSGKTGFGLEVSLPLFEERIFGNEIQISPENSPFRVKKGLKEKLRSKDFQLV